MKQSRAQNLFLEEAKSGETRDHASFKASYVKCGAPFFKDALFVPAPLNEDYKFRKNEGKEYFPFDAPSNSSRWTTDDKVALVLGVKNQMVSHIKSQQSQKLSQCTKSTRGKLQKLKFMAKSTDFEDSSMIEIYENIQKNYPDFQINWNLISFSDLTSRHSVTECMGMWYSYLRPDINREPFSVEENSVMSAVFAENDYQDWGYIASMLKNRSSLQTFVHFHTIYTRLCANNVRWTEKEDIELLNLIEKFSINGEVNWNKIGQLMQMRNRTQCYNRYQILCRLKGQNGRFTSKENRLIMEFVEKYGEDNFKKLPKNFLPGRNKNHIKNHYLISLKQKGDIKPWTREEDEKLMKLVAEQKKPDWRAIADVLETHNRISCRTRHLTIVKFLEKFPDKKLKDVPIKTKRATVVPRMNSDVAESEVAVETLPTAERSALSFKRFKKQNPDLFSMFSTSYNLDFSRHEIEVDSELFHNILALLGYEDPNKSVGRRRHFFTTPQISKFIRFADEKLSEEELEKFEKHAGLALPPNLNTVVGYRAMMIKTRAIEKNRDFSIENPTEDFNASLKIFQQLYFKLFYWPAMLQKIDADELNLAHFSKNQGPIVSSHDVFNKIRSQNAKRLSPFDHEEYCAKKFKDSS